MEFPAFKKVPGEACPQSHAVSVKFTLILSTKVVSFLWMIWS